MAHSRGCAGRGQTDHGRVRKSKTLKERTLVEHPKTGVDAPSLTAFNVRLDGALSNQMSLKLSLPIAD